MNDDRLISFGPGLPAIPEQLLLAHARGEVLFLVGAGASMSAGLPDFRRLVVDVYKKLDNPVYQIIKDIPSGACNQWLSDFTELTPQQASEIKCFTSGDYDVVLGMLERRLDNNPHSESRVRQEIASVIRSPEIKFAPIHRTLMALADRGDAVAIVTTNFDLLLEDGAQRLGFELQTYTLGGIPRPSKRDGFSGVMHIHGALDRDPKKISDVIVSDQDFGEFYLRRRVVSDFIYDAARLFHLVLVGYSANDPPMRYLLNSVAADGNRFSDLKDRFTFIGNSSAADPVEMARWKGRSITPIHYDSANRHSALLSVFEKWAQLSPFSKTPKCVENEIKRIVKTSWSNALQEDRDLLEHLLRRADNGERERLFKVMNKYKTDLSWLTPLINNVLLEDRASKAQRRPESFSQVDAVVLRSVIAFLNNRLSCREAVEWAISLDEVAFSQKQALTRLFEMQNGHDFKEPWKSAWRIIQTGWSFSPLSRQTYSTSLFCIQERLGAGDYSSSIINGLVEYVAPKLEVSAFSQWERAYKVFPKQPKKFFHLFTAKLTSNECIPIGDLKLETISDEKVLQSLARSLSAQVFKGIELEKESSGGVATHYGMLRSLHRVYYVPAAECDANDEEEPDIYNKGIAPSVKLLHAVVERLSRVKSCLAEEFVAGFKHSKTPVHQRLWAALARDPLLATSEEVAFFLKNLDEQQFWNLDLYPEFAELRAKRFEGLSSQDKKALVVRVRSGPRRKFWHKLESAEKLKQYQLYYAVRELSRILSAGGVIAEKDQFWLAAQIAKNPEFEGFDKVTTGFPGVSMGSWVQPKRDDRFGHLQGMVRLQALEEDLASIQKSWDNDPAEQASSWICYENNPEKIFNDFVSAGNGGGGFGRVWDRFCWAANLGENATDIAAQKVRCSQVIALMNILQEEDLRLALAGISHWLSMFQELLIDEPKAHRFWLKLWPIAVEFTNAEQSVENEMQFSTRGGKNSIIVKDIDALNSPVGKLMGVFLAWCPNLGIVQYPFSPGTALSSIRNACLAAQGRSRLLVLHRMIEAIHYLLKADRPWTTQYLIDPLASKGDEAIPLWYAVSKQLRSNEVITVLGDQMVKRALDQRLDRKARASLTSSLILECLRANLEQRETKIAKHKVEQLIRLVDDDVRAESTRWIRRFVVGASKGMGDQLPLTSGEVFLKAVKPFFETTWPKERSLASKGVSRALAELPAACDSAFAQVVSVVSPYLVPIDAVSLGSFGLHGRGVESRLKMIDDEEKAKALLTLLDLTNGTEDGVIVPHDLSSALEQIRMVAPAYIESKAYQRLLTLARRH